MHCDSPFGLCCDPTTSQHRGCVQANKDFHSQESSHCETRRPMTGVGPIAADSNTRASLSSLVSRFWILAISSLKVHGEGIEGIAGGHQDVLVSVQHVRFRCIRYLAEVSMP